MSSALLDMVMEDGFKANDYDTGAEVVDKVRIGSHFRLIHSKLFHNDLFYLFFGRSHQSILLKVTWGANSSIDD